MTVAGFEHIATTQVHLFPFSSYWLICFKVGAIIYV